MNPTADQLHDTNEMLKPLVTALDELFNAWNNDQETADHFKAVNTAAVALKEILDADDHDTGAALRFCLNMVIARYRNQDDSFFTYAALKMATDSPFEHTLNPWASL